jgi:hypothetical protein
MEIIEKKTFNGETMGIDGKHFVRCTLNKCVLIYAGGDFSYTESQINDCQIRLDGPALRTANLLAVFGMVPKAFQQQPPPIQGIPGAGKGEH